MSETLYNIHIWVFLVNSESVLLLAFVKYMLYSHFTQSYIFCIFWRLKILFLWQKIVQHLLIFLYLFWPNNSTTDFPKTFMTQEWLVVERCPIPCWVVFLMLYWLLYNLRSYFNEFIPILIVSYHLVTKSASYIHYYIDVSRFAQIGLSFT